MVTNIMLIQVVNGVSSVIVIVLVLRLFGFVGYHIILYLLFNLTIYHLFMFLNDCFDFCGDHI